MADIYLSKRLIVIPDEFTSIEILAVDLTDRQHHTSLRILLAYRPPNYDQTKNVLLFKALQAVAQDAGRLCIIGDFNLPDFDRHTSVHLDNVLYNAADDFVCFHDLSQFVSDHTRGDNILDIVLKKKKKKFICHEQ